MDNLRDLVVRRVRYGTNCRHIAANRDGRYQSLPLDHLIPLAFYTISTDLKKTHNISYIAQLDVQQYKEDKDDLFSDWQKYCKALNGKLRAMAAFEGAVRLVGQLVPEPERQAWSDRQMTSMRQVIPLDESGARKTKGKRDDSEAQDVPRGTEAVVSRLIADHDAALSLKRIAVPADMNKVLPLLRRFIFVGNKLSHKRRAELRGGVLRNGLSDTVRLHLHPMSGEDCMLEVRVCRSIGQEISMAAEASIEDMVDMFGNYLFDCMEASHCRQQEKSAGVVGTTNAVRVVPCDDDTPDMLLEMKVEFETATEIYEDVFPTLP
ncbi:hypothetical protein CEP54_015069 [Fusarium duplospermum]|uniref:Uncharacterized protein n=1 Tax=Fusarium duplospermum TaxID=1325734 RepID=A0A428NRS2_9HYPO|nr:hypothetical protein CEP54_015069 [Fusarium duplospermum]